MKLQEKLIETLKEVKNPSLAGKNFAKIVVEALNKFEEGHSDRFFAAFKEEIATYKVKSMTATRRSASRRRAA